MHVVLCVFLLLMNFSVKPWWNSPGFLEELSEVGAVGKAGLEGYVQNGGVCGAQKPFGHIEPIVQKVFKGRSVDAGAKAPQAFAFAHGGGAGDILQGQLFLIILLDKGNHGLNAVLAGALSGTGGELCFLKLFKEQKPDVRKHIAGLKFGVVPPLQQGRMAEELQKFFLTGTGSPDLQQLQMLVVENGI